jgi:uncharacterized Zn finger protein
MTTITSIRFRNGYIRHLYMPTEPKTLCGLGIYSGEGLDRTQERTYPLCGNCDRTNARYNHDRVEPEIEAGATRRGSALADAGRVREVTGRIFRVAGTTDTYTVIVPSDKDLASTCTCMAAKTHPETMCKHQSAVYLTIGGSE